MDINELESFKLSDAVSFHKELNPQLWEDEKLDPEVRDQLMLIAEDFVEYLGLSNLKVKDVTISGSNAAYSYTPQSDLDLHVLVDFNELPNNEVYQELFTAKKTLYNDQHDITVHGVPVELYVQDVNQPVQSLGEYSIVHDKWIRIPKKRRANFDEAATKAKYEKLGDLIELALKSRDPKRINDAIALIKRYRKSGLDKHGEFGPENLAYKAVRKQGLVQALYDLKSELHGEKLSIEEAASRDDALVKIKKLLQTAGRTPAEKENIKRIVAKMMQQWNIDPSEIGVRKPVDPLKAKIAKAAYEKTMAADKFKQEWNRFKKGIFAEEETDEDYDPNGPPPGPEFKPTMPAGTVKVDVSDVYDWYKLGQHISNMKGLGKHDFGKGPPSTILSFGDEDTEHEYIQDLEKTGLSTTDIDPVDPNQPKGMKRQKTDPTFNVGEGQGGSDTSWSDGKEKITLQDILELTKHVKQINLPINDNLKSKLLHWDGNPEEIERINQVTVSNQFPILVMVDEQGQINWILDGNHRLHKAIQSKAKTIPAKLIKPSDLSDKARRVFRIEEQSATQNRKAAVLKIQKHLNKKYGANLDLDGKLGPLTLKSINKFMPRAKKGLADEPNKTTAVQGKKLKEASGAKIDAHRVGDTIWINYFEVPVKGKGLGRAEYEKFEKSLPKDIKKIRLVASDAGYGPTHDFWDRMGFDYAYPDDDNEMVKLLEAPRTFQSQVTPLEKLIQDYGYFISTGTVHLEKNGETPEAQQKLLALVQRLQKDAKTFVGLDKNKVESNRDTILNHIHQMMQYAIPILKKYLPADKWEAKRGQINSVLTAYNNARQISEDIERVQGGWRHELTGYRRDPNTGEYPVQPLPLWSVFTQRYHPKPGSGDHIFFYMDFLMNDYRGALLPITGSEIADTISKIYGTNTSDELAKLNAKHDSDWTWDELLEILQMERQKRLMRSATMEASGYIPSEKEKNDPRFKTALTVDVRPDANKKNAKAFGWKVSRAGIPPDARPDGKIK